MPKTNSSSTNDLVQLSFFVDIGKAITRARTIKSTLQEVMNQIGNVFSPRNWSLLLRNPKTGDLKFTKVIGENANMLEGRTLPKGEGIAGWIAENGQSVIVDDVAKDERFSARVDYYTGFETKSIIGVPLKTEERVFGVIELINRTDGEPFTPFDLKVLTSIADFAAIAIEKAYYFRALKKLAVIDPLTGVNNRRSFERLLAREVEMCRRYNSSLSVLMVDVDDFKDINDTHGHTAGDQVLIQLAKVLTSTLRKVDLVCRYGGDEFVIILPNTSKDKAEIARKRILDCIEYENSLGKTVPYRVSIGMHSMDKESSSGLIDMVDMDLYKQKEKKYSFLIESMEDNLQSMLEDERAGHFSREKGEDV